MTDRPLVTAREVADRLGVSAGALLRWARAGDVPAVKLPSGAVRFRPEAIEAWLAELETGAAGRGGGTHHDDHAQPEATRVRLVSAAVPTPPEAADTNEEDRDGRT